MSSIRSTLDSFPSREWDLRRDQRGGNQASGQVEDAMQEKGFTKAEMARPMHTSRAALDRLLDPENGAITLSTLAEGRRGGPRNSPGTGVRDGGAGDAGLLPFVGREPKNRPYWVLATPPTIRLPGICPPETSPCRPL
jgi:hypothetical protein